MANHNQTAVRIFTQYRNRVEASVAFYNKLKNATPEFPYPRLTEKIWKEGILTEIWAIIATRLNRQNVNYLAKWRQGL